MPLKLVISKKKIVPDPRHGENIHCDMEIFLKIYCISCVYCRNVIGKEMS